MKKLKITTITFFLAMSLNSFATYNNQPDQNLIVSTNGFGFQCIGFCSGHQEDSEIVAKRNAVLKAERQCQDEGHEIATLIDGYYCNSYNQMSANIEIVTYCDATYLCD